MQEEANIVKQYEEANVSGRIEILIKYYPNFIRLVEGYEQSLSFIIKEEKAYKHRQAKGELGVRVQTSGMSDPTAREAIDNIMIMDAIRAGDLSSIIRDLDEEVSKLHEAEVATLQNMKEDHSVLQSTFYYLDPDAADTAIHIPIHWEDVNGYMHLIFRLFVRRRRSSCETSSTDSTFMRQANC